MSPEAIVTHLFCINIARLRIYASLGIINTNKRLIALVFLHVDGFTDNNKHEESRTHLMRR